MLPFIKKGLKIFILPPALIFAGLFSLKAQPLAVKINNAMGRGISLGNTMEPPNEGDWNNGPVQEYYFDDFKEAGFTSVRIPIRWDKHSSTTPPYSIDESWLDRVEQIVDWGLARGLCIIINAHHEEWFKLGYSQPENRARFDSIWSQVSTRFNKKSEKLVFEIIDEPTGMSSEEVDELNSRIIKIIRRKNPTRVVLYSGNRRSNSDELLEADIPRDDYLIGYFHSFDPENFAQLGVGNWGTEEEIKALEKRLYKISDWSLMNQLPINLGAFGVTNMSDFNSRMHLYATYAELCMKYNFSFNLWDDGDKYPVYDRVNRKWNEIKDVVMNASQVSPTMLKIELEQDSIITLNWKNRTLASTQLIIERGIGEAVFVPIDTLKADSTYFSETVYDSGHHYYYRIVQTDGQNAVPSYPVRIYVSNITRFPFHDVPFEIPCTIEAEDFDIGAEGFTYHDSDEENKPSFYRRDEGVDIECFWNGYRITDVDEGEWCEYTFNAKDPGIYKVAAFVSSTQEGGKIRLKIMDDSTDCEVPQTFDLVTQTSLCGVFQLDSGLNILRFEVVKSAPFNIDRFEITPLNQENDAANVAVYSKRKGIITVLNPDNKKGTVTFSNVSGQVHKTGNIDFIENEFIVPSKHMVIYHIEFQDETNASGKLFVK
ncbi:MAG: cellulase family glycosylhydrolase [Prolixibacteraceae bacterium]|nr:cellulase family glycosylhydrolase [Prolixibacteraceae bacterium]